MVDKLYLLEKRSSGGILSQLGFMNQGSYYVSACVWFDARVSFPLFVCHRAVNKTSPVWDTGAWHFNVTGADRDGAFEIRAAFAVWALWYILRTSMPGVLNVRDAKRGGL